MVRRSACGAMLFTGPRSCSLHEPIEKVRILECNADLCSAQPYIRPAHMRTVRRTLETLQSAGAQQLPHVAMVDLQMIEDLRHVEALLRDDSLDGEYWRESPAWRPEVRCLALIEAASRDQHLPIIDIQPNVGLPDDRSAIHPDHALAGRSKFLRDI